MTVETDVHRAIEHVSRERERTAEKRRRFERFEAAVEDLETVQPMSSGRGAAAGAGGAWTTAASNGVAAAATSTASGNSTGAILEAFEEHLGEHTGDALTEFETVHEAVAEEFSTDLATALCGGSAAGAVTPSLKAAVLEEARSRTAELDVTTAALECERESLDATRESLAPVLEWFVEHNPTPLSELGFEALRRWHERVDEHRTRLEGAAAERQSHLRDSTSRAGAVGIQHDALREYCYAEFADSHPALATIARFDEACRSAQRALREHLVRRV